MAAVAVGRAEAHDAARRPTTPTASCAAGSTTALAQLGARLASRRRAAGQGRRLGGAHASATWSSNYKGEVADLISTHGRALGRRDTCRRIELQVGRDLQFIRINGTIVGGLAGLAIYTVSQLIT